MGRVRQSLVSQNRIYHQQRADQRCNVWANPDDSEVSALDDTLTPRWTLT